MPNRPPTTTSPRYEPATSSRRTVGMPADGGSMSMPAISMIFGIEPRVAMPISPQAVQSMTMPLVSGRRRRRLLVSLHNRSLAAL